MEVDERRVGATPVEDLARHVHETMEVLDPMGAGWDDLSIQERNYCVALTRKVLDRRELVIAALAFHSEAHCDPSNDDGAVSGRSKSFRLDP